MIILPLLPISKEERKSGLEEQPIVSHKHFLYTRCHSHSYTRRHGADSQRTWIPRGREQ